MQTEAHPITVVAQSGESQAPVEVAVDVSPARSLRDGEVRDVHRTVKRRRGRGWLALASLAAVASGAGVTHRIESATRAATRRRRGISLGVIVGSAALGAGLVRWQLARLFTEEPSYTVELREGDFEVRRYRPVVLAETPVDGTWRHALDEGFQRLADYVFGKANMTRSSLTWQPSARQAPRKLPMTAPVVGAREGDHHVVSFVMPEEETLETLPAPTDPRVALEPVGARRVAVLRFHGNYDAETVRAKQEELFHLVTRRGFTPVGEPEFAGYDPPWTLPVLRRVEVWIALA
jgi:hypothetical protein